MGIRKAGGHVLTDRGWELEGSRPRKAEPTAEPEAKTEAPKPKPKASKPAARKTTPRKTTPATKRR